MTGRAGAKPAHVYHHGALREAMISAALREVAVRGLEQVSLRSITRTLGVSSASPYAHFCDRDDLFAAVAARGFRDMRASLSATKSDAQLANLAEIARQVLEFARANFDRYRLMFSTRLLQEARPGSELHVTAEACFEVLLATIPPLDDDTLRRRYAFRFWTSLHGLVLADQGFLAPAGVHPPTQCLIDDLVRDFDAALAVRQGAAKRANEAS